MRRTVKDVNVFDINSGNFLAFFDSINVEFNHTEAMTSAPTRDFKRRRLLSREGSFSTTVRKDTGTAGVNSANVDISATLDGNNICSILKSAKVSLNNDVSNEKGACSGSAYNQVLDSDISIELELYTNTDEADWIIEKVETGGDDLYMVFSLNTGNGDIITLPVALVNLSDEVAVGAVMSRKLTLAGMDSLTGDFPTVPTSGTSLMQVLLVNPRTVMACETEFDNVNSYSMAGNFVAESASINVPQDGVLTYEYSFKSQGAITITNNNTP